MEREVEVDPKTSLYLDLIHAQDKAVTAPYVFFSFLGTTEA